MHWKRLTAVGLVVLIGISMALALLGDSTPLDLDAIDTTGVDGALVFANSCAVCHGRGLRGTSSGPPLLDARYRPGLHADEGFVTTIRLGVRQHHWQFGNMRPVEGLTDAQIAAVIQFIREEQRAVGIE